MAAVVNAEQVCFQHRAKIFGRLLGDGFKDSDAGVVDEYVEATEFLSLMQWKSPEEVREAVAAKHEKFKDELADVLHSVLLLASDLKVDISTALEEKLAKDQLKYPVDKARGNSRKRGE